jgi:hypothetical protein
MRIHKNNPCEIAMQGTHHCCVLGHVLRVSHSTVRAPIQHVATLKRRSRFLSPRLDPESAFAGITFPPATTEPNSLS